MTGASWHAARTIAAYTVIEALRNRLIWLFALLALAAVALGGLVSEIALTESDATALALMAAAMRLGAVFLVASFVVTSLQREQHDKGLELLLALPMPRAAYLFGKLAGFAALCLLPAMLFGSICLILAPAGQCLLWATSLLCELWIVAGFCLLCALTFSQAMPALAAAGGFYLLARAIGALQLLSHGVTAPATPGRQLMGGAIDLLASLLPRLDDFTRTQWLLYHDGTPAMLAAIAAQSAIYLALLTAAALFDLYRKRL